MSHFNTDRVCVTPHFELSEIPDIKEISCPITERYSRTFSCEYHMDRNELSAHISLFHPDHHEDPESYFEDERERRFK